MHYSFIHNESAIFTFFDARFSSFPFTVSVNLFRRCFCLFVLCCICHFFASVVHTKTEQGVRFTCAPLISTILQDHYNAITIIVYKVSRCAVIIASIGSSDSSYANRPCSS